MNAVTFYFLVVVLLGTSGDPPATFTFPEPTMESCLQDLGSIVETARNDTNTSDVGATCLHVQLVPFKEKHS